MTVTVEFISIRLFALTNDLNEVSFNTSREVKEER